MFTDKNSCDLADETINTENLNGHATSSGTSEEVKVHVESSETEERDRAGESLSKESKTGKSTCSSLYSACDLCCFQYNFLNKDTQLVRKKASVQQRGPFSQVLWS